METAARARARKTRKPVKIQEQAQPETQVGPGQLTSLEGALQFMLAGKAIVTVVSKKTGNRFTYKITKGRRTDAPYFVALMNGPDNESNYEYLGTLHSDTLEWRHGRKSVVSPDASSVKAFEFVWGLLHAGRFPSSAEIWHEGRCGRCGRTLTVPESISLGIGPECRKRVGL